MAPTSTKSESPSISLDARAIEGRLNEVGGLESTLVGFDTKGLTRRAFITFYVTTDDPARLGAIQDYATRLVYANTVLPRPAAILEVFAWSPALGKNVERQSPRAAIVSAFESKVGIDIRKNGENTQVFALVDTSKFEGGLVSTSIPPMPAVLGQNPPPLTAAPATTQ